MSGVKKLERLKKIKKTEDGKIIRNATNETAKKVKMVCEEYARKKRRVGEICREMGWGEQSFYKAIRQYGDCKEMANAVGLGLRGDADITPAKAQMPEIPPDKSFTIFDLLHLRKTWTDEQKLKAIKTMLEKLAMGIPLAYACALSGISRKVLEEWCREFPDLIERIQCGDAPMIEMMMGWLAEAGTVAAKQGKFGEILKGVEQRLPEKFGTLDRIEVVTRRGKEESILSLSATDAKDVGFEIEEK